MLNIIPPIGPKSIISRGICLKMPKNAEKAYLGHFFTQSVTFILPDPIPCYELDAVTSWVHGYNLVNCFFNHLFFIFIRQISCLIYQTTKQRAQIIAHLLIKCIPVTEVSQWIVRIISCCNRTKTQTNHQLSQNITV